MATTVAKQLFFIHGGLSCLSQMATVEASVPSAEPEEVEEEATQDKVEGMMLLIVFFLLVSFLSSCL